MATSQMKLPKGFVLEEPNQPKLPKGFQIEKPQEKIISEPIDISDFEIEQWAKPLIESGEIQPTEPTFAQQLWSKMPQMTGGTIGGTIGFRETFRRLPPTMHPAARFGLGLAGAGAGAAFGAMGGKGWQQYYQMKTAPPGTRPKSLRDLYIEQLWAGLEEGLTEMGGRGVSKGISIGAPKFFKGYFTPAMKAMIPGAREAGEVLARYGTHLTYGQGLQSRIFDMAEEIAEGSWFGGGKLHKLKRITQPRIIRQIFDDSVDDFAKQVGRQMTPEEIGTLVWDVINRENKTFRAMSRAFYGHIDNVIKKAGGRSDIIDLTKLKSYAAHRLTDSAAIAKSQTGQNVLETILKHPNKVNFKQATSIRSQLMLLERSMADTKDVAHGTLRQLIKMTDQSIETGGRQLRGDGFRLWRNANRFHREGKIKFNAKIIKNIQRNLQDRPERFVGMIYRPHASKQIKQLHNVIDERTKKALKYGLVQHLVESAEDVSGKAILGVSEEGKTIVPIIGSKFINNLNGLGDDVLKLTFNDDEIKALRLIGRTAELTQGAGMFGKGGRMLVTLTQAGIVIGLASFKPTRPGSGVIMFGPYVLARMATNPTISKLLSIGLKTAPDAPLAATIAARLIREGYKYQKEEQRFKIKDKKLPPLKERLSIKKALEATGLK